MTNSVYAVTGASGHLGRLAVQDLLARGVPSGDIVAIVRTGGKVADLAQRGVDVRVADYTRPDTQRAALVGVNRLLLVSSSAAGQRLAQHTNVIAAAKTAGVSRIVYTGILNADHTSNPLAGEHQDTERALRQTSLPFIALATAGTPRTTRIGSPSTLKPARSSVLPVTAESRRRRDRTTPAAAVAALLQNSEGNRTYELGGS